jgi:hypothetical protein
MRPSGRSHNLISGKRFFGDCTLRIFLLGAAATLMSLGAHGQSVSTDELPDAPVASAQQSSAPPTPAPAPATATATTPAQSQTPQQNQTPPPASSSSSPQPAPAPGQSGSSSSAQPAQNTPETKEQQQERAKRELEAEEKQRLLGVVPMFNVQSNANAAPMTSKQKYQLFFKSSTDWYVFAITAIDGEISLLGTEYPSYGEGVEGFAKYWGAAYADTFDGNLWGNAILTSWWHEDPRYYRMGHGNLFKRAGYSALTTIWCKRDKGTWGPNYANVAGNFVGGTISNLYYPKSSRGVELTLGRGASVTYEGAVGAEIAEFWPDIVNHFAKKHQEKLANQAGQQPGAASPAPAQPQGNGTAAPAQPTPKPQ